jgi:hypothetical protein
MSIVADWLLDGRTSAFALPLVLDFVFETAFELELGALEPAQPQPKDVSNVNDTMSARRCASVAG